MNNAAAQGRNTNQPPYLSSTSLTRSVQENLAIGTTVGEPMKGIDPEGLTVTYGMTYGVGSYAYFAIDSTTGQLSTKQVLDYESKTSHTIRVFVTDPGGNSNHYDVTINVINDTSDDILTNSPPVFIEGDSTTRNIVASDPNSLYLGSPILATDADGGTLYYAVTNEPSGILYMGNPGYDDTVKWRRETPQLKHQLPPEFRSVGDTYTAELTVWDDQNATDTIQITINVVANNSPPAFLEGSSATRSIEENTGTSIDIGTPIYAIDAEESTIAYSLGGTDASSFSINSSTGQLQTAVPLDYESKNVYTVTVTVSDGKGGSGSITVTIKVTDVNETEPTPPIIQNSPPRFSEGVSTTRSIAENTPSNRNIGSPVSATDIGDILTYNLSGTDAASFIIVNTSGQLRTAATLDYETKNAYTVTVTVSDGKGGSDRITVTIKVTDVSETVAPFSVQQPPPQSQTDPQPQPETDPESEHEPKTEIEPIPEPEPEPNYTIFPFDYEKEGVGKVVFTEVMLARLNKYPQWIELYNTTNQDIDVKGWKIVGRYLDDSNTMNILESQIISKSLTIKGKETVLIVSYATLNSRDRISKDLVDKTYDLGSNSKNFWNYEGIVLELQDTEGNPIDRMGNLNENNEIIFEIPSDVRNKRVSLMRRLKSMRTEKYDFTFGMKEFGWFPANEAKRLTLGRSKYYYGMYTDIGSPGYRTEVGELLPVTLSSFNPQINQDGSVVISWVTESEVDNAGFNILRCEKPQGPFIKVNPKLIQGAGTTGKQNKYVWTDNTAKPNVEYYYQIEDVSFAGVSQTLATKLVKGIFTAKNRQTTSWGNLKREFNLKYSRF